MLCNIFVKYVLTLQPINKGQCRANNYLPTSGLLFFAKAGKLSSKFSVSGFVFCVVGCCVVVDFLLGCCVGFVLGFCFFLGWGVGWSIGTGHSFQNF